MSERRPQSDRRTTENTSKKLPPTHMKLPLFRSPRPAATAVADAAPARALRLPVCAPALVHGSLAVYPLLRPANSAQTAPYQSLTAALADGRARLHEGDGLRETEVENLTETDLFLAAGEMVSGGWQDWTLGVDLIVPRRSSRRGRLALREFCLNPGRWRDGATDRREVSRAFGDARSAVPASERALAKLSRSHPGAVGFALAVNGTARAAHLFAGPDLFSALWPGTLDRLLSAASLGDGATTAAATAPDAGLMSAWVARACRTAAESVGDSLSLTPRVTLLGRPADAEGSAARLVSLETLDNGRGGLCVHQAIVPGAR